MPTSGVIALSQPKEGAYITICVPVYNVKQYLRECLDSIFLQDYDKFDVIMVDDGSFDGSEAICDEYVDRYPHQAAVIHKNNGGLLLARRDAFARAAGQYVMCVDSDDILVPGALSAVSVAIAKTSADVIRFGFTRERDAVVSVDGTVSYEFYAAEEKPAVLRSLCCSTSGSENPMCFKAIRRECIGADVDFSPFKGLSFAEDFLQTLTVYDKAATFCFLDACLYFYRPGSGITRSYNPSFYRDVCRCLDVAEDYGCRWECDYACDGLMVGLASCRLDSAAQYAEWMASKGDKESLNVLRKSEDFERCSNTARTSKLLRFDRRLVLGALRMGLYPLIAVIAKVRALVTRKQSR